MRRVLLVLAVLAGLVAVTSVALAAVTSVQLASGDNAHVTCNGAHLWKTANTATDWTVKCRGTATPTPTTSSSPAPSTSSSSPAPSTSTPPSSSASSGPGWQCVTSDQMGHCGGYPPHIAGMPDSYDDQNVWSPVTGWKQTLSANSPADWQVAANMPAGNTSVVSFPNTGQPMNEAPLAGFASLTSSFTETMNQTAATSGWSMYDIYVDNWSYEVMIQVDFANNGDCSPVASVTFAGQAWHLCTFGSTFAWKLGAGEGTQKQSERSGMVDLKAMFGWLEQHGYLPAGTTFTNISFGWEICSTGGQDETFRVADYSLQGT